MATISVIVCSHNPHPGRIERALTGLKAQTLDPNEWELILIDNRSDPPLSQDLVAWHPNGRVVREESLGLTPARVCGVRESQGGSIVLVDDDNVLADQFLAMAALLSRDRPEWGVFGGPVRPEFEIPPPDWFAEFGGPLGITDHGPAELAARWLPTGIRSYPRCSPIGAGMCIRREVAENWATSVGVDPVRQALDRRGQSLASGGDNDIVLTALQFGKTIGYHPELVITHLMPAGRLTPDYHRRILRASNRTWVVVLQLHGINPWKPIPAWTLPLRKLKAYLAHKPWRGIIPSLKWQAAAGKLEGQAVAGRIKRSEAHL